MLNFIATFGRGVMFFFSELGGIVTLLKNVFKYIPQVYKDRKLLIDQMGVIGADSLPLVLLIGSFTGAIAALQATLLFSKFNLISITRPFLGGSIATAVFTELRSEKLV